MVQVSEKGDQKKKKKKKKNYKLGFELDLGGGGVWVLFL
jgi:hypothetical protein